VTKIEWNNNQISHLGPLNEEHSIGGARLKKESPQSVKGLGRALPIEFVELSRSEAYGD